MRKQQSVRYRLRRGIAVVILLGGIGGGAYAYLQMQVSRQSISPDVSDNQPELERAGDSSVETIRQVLAQLAVKGRAPKTGYSRTQFGNGWASLSGCDTRNSILYRDLQNAVTDDRCRVVSGTLHDPYTGSLLQFQRGETTSQAVQIDHVVALSNAWQTGAQQLDTTQRVAFANDPLNLLAVDGAANQQKSDADAATWLPPQKSFRCDYVARQIVVKQKYSLWVVEAEKSAMERVLSSCQSIHIPTQ